MHQTVLLREAVDALVTMPDGFYVDGTFGRGGHSRYLLERLNDDGRVLAVDKDLAAQAAAEELASVEPRFEIFSRIFRSASPQLRRMGIDAVDGILLDLGVSSPQLDDGERGFSFLQDGPLDMRMDTSRGETAAQWLSHAEVEEIAGVLKEYGEERFARRIAAAIVAAQDRAGHHLHRSAGAGGQRGQSPMGKTQASRHPLFPGDSHQGQSRTGRPAGIAGGGAGHVARWRSSGGDQFSLPGGSPGQALYARYGPG